MALIFQFKRYDTMNHATDGLSRCNAERLEHPITSVITSAADGAPMTSASQGGQPFPARHIDALAAIGASALALSRIRDEDDFTKLVDLVTEGISDLEMAKFERLVAEAEIGLLDAYVTSQSGSSDDNSKDAPTI